MFPFFCNAILAGAMAFTPNVDKQKEADDVRLNCGTPIGPNQQILVFQSDDRFYIIETPKQGAGFPLEPRDITAEWLTGEVTLRDDGSGTRTKLFSAGDDAWELETTGPKYFESAPADCR
jgi:hypothetical protein